MINAEGENVDLYIQFGSQQIRKYAEEQGYTKVFEEAGVTMIDPSCGACIKAGPGVSFEPDEVTVSAINRNFPGRSGPGEMYLASPLTVAASALAGYIVAYDGPESVGQSPAAASVGRDGRGEEETEAQAQARRGR